MIRTEIAPGEIHQAEEDKINPFLRVIRDEARKLANGFLVSVGHVNDVLGANVFAPEGEAKLKAFCGEHALDVAFDGRDGLRFRDDRDTPEEESEKPAPTAA